MRLAYKILRTLIATVLVLAGVVPLALYLILSSSAFQNKVRDIGQQELSNLLGTEVSINGVEISGLNQLLLSDITVKDDYGANALRVGQIAAGFDTWQFIFSRRIVIDYVRVSALIGKVYKPTPESRLNIQDIMDRLKPKEKKEPKHFDLKINTVLLNGVSLHYDVVSAPQKPLGVFDPNHISVEDLTLAAHLDRISDKRIRVFLQQLSFREKDNIRLKDLTTDFELTDELLALGETSLSLDNSLVHIAPIVFHIASRDEVSKIFKEIPIHLIIKDDSYITPADLQAFVPQLKVITSPVDIDLNLWASANSMRIDGLYISHPEALNISVRGSVDSLQNLSSLEANLPMVSVRAYGPALASYLAGTLVDNNVANRISALGRVNFYGSAVGSAVHGTLKGALVTTPGDLNLNLSFTRNQYKKSVKLVGEVYSTGIDLAELLPGKNIGLFEGRALLDGLLSKNDFRGSARLDIERFEYKGYTYNDITGQLVKNGDIATFNFSSVDPNVRFFIDGNLDLGQELPTGKVDVDVQNVDLDQLNLWDKYPGYRLSANMHYAFEGHNIDDAVAEVSLKNFRFRNPASDDEIFLKNFDIDVFHNDPSYKHIEISSDFLNGTIEGQYDLKSLQVTFRDLLGEIFPDYLPENFFVTPEATDDQITMELTVGDASRFCEFFHLPVQILNPTYIQARMDGKRRYFSADIDAPYMMQSGKVIEDIGVHITLDGNDKEGYLFATTQLYTGKGLMPLILYATAKDNNINVNLDWSIERELPINGTLSLGAYITRSLENKLQAVVTFNPGQINFGETLWNILPSKIVYRPEYIKVENFCMQAQDQKINIDGSDPISISLENIHLIDIFETLGIDKANIGGLATGEILVSEIFSTDKPSGIPNIITPKGLSVKGISYNKCTLGDAMVLARWNPEKESFDLDATIDQANHLQTTVRGGIYPLRDSLDIEFNARKTNIAFMQKFMEGFTPDVSGTASGRAHLYGTFALIDLEGDLYVDSLRIKLDFTNTYYYAKGDSLHIDPGRINIKDITIYDEAGNTALLNGYVAHNYFLDPIIFKFNVTDIQDVLCYDVPEKLSPIWYGKVFCNGSAFIDGKPGIVTIDLNVITRQGSTFTFVLSDMEEAYEYGFITFRDKTPPKAKKDSILDVDITPEQVIRFYESKRKGNNSSNTNYDINLQVDINKDAQIILVMDPLAGDRIVCTGDGHLRLTYENANEDLKMWGTYTLAQGKYNFTFQDIIIKEFIIDQGSSITFLGDPYSAQLDIKAKYPVNANLSDLDKSFLQDKEINRTKVPVNAILKATGDMRQPDISFDLQFPSLQDDIYRKVRSIISTDDMMNRQIIYLLALNRFYTPEYMNTTKGNELFSVASSTIGAQISNMLGQLSDNWSIAPNLRSDAGDFSDVEVDVALSSSLLNNRLLLNGNFGYRDKSLNTNQFIGDFDIEYLLDPKGRWRLKAYNRYNDQNYYLRTATTTQGIGIVAKREFDNLLSFTKPKKDDDTQEKSDSTDLKGNKSLTIELNDSIHVDNLAPGVEEMQIDESEKVIVGPALKPDTGNDGNGNGDSGIDVMGTGSDNSSKDVAKTKADAVKPKQSSVSISEK